MKQKIALLLTVATLAFMTGAISAGARMISADEAPPQPLDPKKKKPGDACKASDECQNHHSCEKEKGNEKRVCKAPPPPKLPPGVVT